MIQGFWSSDVCLQVSCSLEQRLTWLAQNVCISWKQKIKVGDSIRTRWKGSLKLGYQGFPGGSEVKVSACNVGDLGSIPGSGRSLGEGNGNPLQYSCLENPTDGGQGHKESDMTEQLNFHFHFLMGLYLFQWCHAVLTQLCQMLSDPIDCSLPGSSVYGIFLGKNTGVGCHALLQGIFPTQGSSSHLLHLLHCK